MRRAYDTDSQRSAAAEGLVRFDELHNARVAWIVKADEPPVRRDQPKAACRCTHRALAILGTGSLGAGCCAAIGVDLGGLSMFSLRVLARGVDERAIPSCSGCGRCGGPGLGEQYT